MNQEEIVNLTQFEVAKTLSPILKRLTEAETTINALMANCKALSKITDHAVANCGGVKPDEVKQLKADLLQLGDKFSKLQNSFATGHGMQQSTTMSKEDFADVRDERIKLASLREIAEACGV